MEDLKKKDAQRERWVIVTQVWETTVICLATAKSRLCCSTCCHIYKGDGQSTCRAKKAWTSRKYEGLCEVEVNQVGSSSAADWGLCLQEICWNPPLPASQGSCKGINQDFIQASPDTLTMSQSSKNKNYSWGNKVSSETSYFSMETIYVIDQEWKGKKNPFWVDRAKIWSIFQGISIGTVWALILVKK